MRGRGFGLASGKVKERLGSIASEKAISLIAIHAHDIPQAFSRDAMPEAEAAEPATLQGREDWRDVPLVTIDPPDAKDHDDAVHARARSRSEQQGRLHRRMSPSPTSPSTCGRAPRSTATRSVRGNSVYFPDRVVPMLPERISNDLCSLVPGETARRARGAAW